MHHIFYVLEIGDNVKKMLYFLWHAINSIIRSLMLEEAVQLCMATVSICKPTIIEQPKEQAKSEIAGESNETMPLSQTNKESEMTVCPTGTDAQSVQILKPSTTNNSSSKISMPDHDLRPALSEQQPGMEEAFSFDGFADNCDTTMISTVHNERKESLQVPLLEQVPACQSSSPMNYDTELLHTSLTFSQSEDKVIRSDIDPSLASVSCVEGTTPICCEKSNADANYSVSLPVSQTPVKNARRQSLEVPLLDHKSDSDSVKSFENVSKTDGARMTSAFSKQHTGWNDSKNKSQASVISDDSMLSSAPLIVDYIRPSSTPGLQPTVNNENKQSLKISSLSYGSREKRDGVEISEQVFNTDKTPTPSEGAGKHLSDQSTKIMSQTSEVVGGDDGLSRSKKCVVEAESPASTMQATKQNEEILSFEMPSFEQDVDNRSDKSCELFSGDYMENCSDNSQPESASEREDSVLCSEISTVGATMGDSTHSLVQHGVMAKKTDSASIESIGNSLQLSIQRSTHTRIFTASKSLSTPITVGRASSPLRGVKSTTLNPASQPASINQPTNNGQNQEKSNNIPIHNESNSHNSHSDSTRKKVRTRERIVVKHRTKVTPSNSPVNPSLTPNLPHSPIVSGSMSQKRTTVNAAESQSYASGRDSGSGTKIKNTVLQTQLRTETDQANSRKISPRNGSPNQLRVKERRKVRVRSPRPSVGQNSPHMNNQTPTSGGTIAGWLNLSSSLSENSGSSISQNSVPSPSRQTPMGASPSIRLNSSSHWPDHIVTRADILSGSSPKMAANTDALVPPKLSHSPHTAKGGLTGKTASHRLNNTPFKNNVNAISSPVPSDGNWPIERKTPNELRSESSIRRSPSPSVSINMVSHGSDRTSTRGSFRSSTSPGPSIGDWSFGKNTPRNPNPENKTHCGLDKQSITSSCRQTPSPDPSVVDHGSTGKRTPFQPNSEVLSNQSSYQSVSIKLGGQISDNKTNKKSFCPTQSPDPSTGRTSVGRSTPCDSKAENLNKQLSAQHLKGEYVSSQVSPNLKTLMARYGIKVETFPTPSTGALMSNESREKTPLPLSDSSSGRVTDSIPNRQSSEKNISVQEPKTKFQKQLSNSSLKSQQNVVAKTSVSQKSSSNLKQARQVTKPSQYWDNSTKPNSGKASQLSKISNGSLKMAGKGSTHSTGMPCDSITPNHVQERLITKPSQHWDKNDIGSTGTVTNLSQRSYGSLSTMSNNSKPSTGISTKGVTPKPMQEGKDQMKLGNKNKILVRSYSASPKPVLSDVNQTLHGIASNMTDTSLGITRLSTSGSAQRLAESRKTTSKKSSKTLIASDHRCMTDGRSRSPSIDSKRSNSRSSFWLGHSPSLESIPEHAVFSEASRSSSMLLPPMNYPNSNNCSPYPELLDLGSAASRGSSQVSLSRPSQSRAISPISVTPNESGRSSIK